MNIDYEMLFQWVGIIVAFSASIYSYKFGNKLASSLFLLFVILQAQTIFVVQFIGLPENNGACWATKNSFYTCLPFLYKLSFHSAQAGNYFLALAMVLALKGRSNGNNHV